MATLRDIVRTHPRAVCATQPKATVSEAVEQMCTRHVRALLVVDPDEPVGIICERDVLERVIRENRNPRDTPVEAAMTTPLFSLPADASLSEALAFMIEHRVHQVPIVSGHAVVGVVSSTDLLRWSARLQEEQIRTLTDYCSGRYPA